MNAGRDVERLIATWLAEEAPGPAPDRVLAAAGTRVDRTNQRRYAALRDLPIPWRPKTMFERLAVAAVVAVVAIGTFALGASLVLKPHEPAAGACPREFSEAQAVDTSLPGLTQAQRTWGIAGGTPGRVRPGLIAAYAKDTPAGPPSVITIDPATGARCRLLTYVDAGPFGASIDRLDWSPSGDALAMGIENADFGSETDSGPDPTILIWTPGRLFRIWSGPGQVPSFEWAPDGRSIAVWMPVGGAPFNARIIFADGSPDREVGVQPFGWERIKWSPDGSRWIVGLATAEACSGCPNTISVVDLADGRITPIDIGISRLFPKGWIDNGRVLLYGGPDVGYLDVPLAAPDSYSVVPLPGDAPLNDNLNVFFSPDHSRVTYRTQVNTSTGEGDREIADLTAAPGGAPIHVDVGRGFTAGLGWAPDGSQLVLTNGVGPLGTTPTYANSTFTTWIVSADGANVRQILVGYAWPTEGSWQPVPIP